MHFVLRLIDKIVNIFVSLVVIIALLFSVWSLYDVAKIYGNAKTNFWFGKNSKELSLIEYRYENKDVCAKLKIPNTGINYPVLQGETNSEYINKTYDGSYNIAGSVFIDSKNASDFSDSYTLFYGHRMEASAMFGDITKFTEEAFFYNHPKGILITPNKEYQIKFFACSKTLASNMYFFDVDEAKADRKRLLREIEKSSIQQKDITIKDDDKIVALSTCESATTSGRVILFGILKGES